MAAQIGASWVFVVNAASYLLVIWALYTRASCRRRCRNPSEEGQGLRRLLSGFRAARADPWWAGRW